jgi:hypothetical protein
MKNQFKSKSFLMTIFCTGLFFSTTNAQSITPFAIWKQVTQRGDITFTGNSMLTCAASGTCTTALGAISPTGSGGGNNFNNNGFVMNYINIADATDPTTRFSRSNANLALQVAVVLFMQNYFGEEVFQRLLRIMQNEILYILKRLEAAMLA